MQVRGINYASCLKKKNHAHTKKNRFLFLFLLFTSSIKQCMTLYFNTTTPDPMQHATTHGSSPTTTSTFSPWPSMSPHQFQPNRTRSGRVGQTSPRQSGHPAKWAWVVPGSTAGVGGHPSASVSQPDSVLV